MAAGVKGVQAVVLFSARLEEMLRFYRAIGVQLEDEQHDDGPLHYACQLGDVHFAIHEGTPGDSTPRAGGAGIIGFGVPSIENAMREAQAVGSSVVSGPERMPWGLRCLVLDPDGREIELVESPD